VVVLIDLITDLARPSVCHFFLVRAPDEKAAEKKEEIGVNNPPRTGVLARVNFQFKMSGLWMCGVVFLRAAAATAYCCSVS